MKIWQVRRIWIWQVTVGMLFAVTAYGADSGIPPDSAFAQTAGGCQRLLLNPMEDATSVATGGWKMNGTYVAPDQRRSPKLGHTALTLGAADAEQAGSKGDFRVRDEVPGQVQTFGMWVRLTEQSNVARVGLQLYDAQGEALMVLVPADWSGWKWIDLDVADVEQSYPQTDKNRMADYPLKSVHVVWFAKTAGPTSLAVDCLVALTRLQDASDSSISVDTSVPEMVEAGGKLPASVSATN